MSTAHLCRFTSLDHLSHKQLNDDEAVLGVLRKNPKVSSFEMSENIAVRHAVQRLEHGGSVRIDYKRLEYPWIYIEILDTP